jgi:hypothetical protein
MINQLFKITIPWWGSFFILYPGGVFNSFFWRRYFSSEEKFPASTFSASTGILGIFRLLRPLGWTGPIWWERDKEWTL